VNQQMTQQLQTTGEAAQQQMPAEDQPAVAAPEPATEQPAAVAASSTPASTISGKLTRPNRNGALENDATAGAIPTALELLPYLKDSIFPSCPAGGTYTINAVGVPPTCSIPGHALPQ